MTMYPPSCCHNGFMTTPELYRAFYAHLLAVFYAVGITLPTLQRKQSCMWLFFLVFRPRQMRFDSATQIFDFQRPLTLILFYFSPIFASTSVNGLICFLKSKNRVRSV